MSFTLGKSDKLKSKKLIQQLFEEGESMKQYPIRLRYIKVKDVDYNIRVGFSVPKRNFKSAVDRNRIKRLMREAYRLNKLPIFEITKSSYVMMFIYTDRKVQDFTVLEAKMIALLHKFNMVENEMIL